MGNEHGAVDDDLVRSVGHVDHQIAANDVNIAQLHAGRKGDGPIGAGNDFFGIGEIQPNPLDTDRKLSAVVGAEPVGQRIGERVGHAIGAAGIGGVGVIAVAIDPDHAIFAGDVEMTSCQAGIGPASA